MTAAPERVATVVLVDAGGAVLGHLAPIALASPWWNDIGPLVQALLARDGLRVTVLRLLSAALPAQPGGAVTYLAQVDTTVPAALLQPWLGELPEHPLRHAYARVGGPHADLAWAYALLRARGRQPAGPAEQVRTWNLSSLWRLPMADGQAVWLKVVPPFFGHEGDVLALLADGPVPLLLGRAGCRLLLAPLAGEDLYDADLAQCRVMIDRLVALQARWLGRCAELVPLGLPDWRALAMTRAITALLKRRGGELQSAHQQWLTSFVNGLSARWAALADCGLPDGLVHGDFHRGNCRGQGIDIAVLDWADSGMGHVLLDQTAFLSRLPVDFVEPARQHWTQTWQRLLPQAQVERAAELLAPLASLRQALIYQRFLDHIEDAEHPYHRSDVPDWLARTAQIVQAERGNGY